MAHLEDTVKVEIAEFPGPDEPPPWQRWGLLGSAAVIALLVLSLALVLAGRSRSQMPPKPLVDTTATSVGLTQGPPFDVVTGEPIDPATAPFRAEFYGTELYFATRESFEAFRKDPLAYVNVKMKVDVQLSEGDDTLLPAAISAEPEPTDFGPEAAHGAPMGAPGSQDLSIPGAPGPETAPPPGPPEPETDADGWSDAREPPPPIDSPTQAPPAAVPARRAAPPPGLPADDVVLTPMDDAPPEGLGDDGGDVILDADFQKPPGQSAQPAAPAGRPGPAGPATPLP